MGSPDQMKIINETKNENSTMMQNPDDFIVVQTQDALREASDLDSNDQPSHSTDEMYKNMNQVIDSRGSQREANDSAANTQNETFRNEYQFAS